MVRTAQRRRRAFGAALALGLLLSACGGGEAKMSGLGFWSTAFPGQPDAQGTFEEHAKVPHRSDDELAYVAADFDGKHTTVVDYERRSSVGRGPTVWFFGGSTMFGLGQRDEHTIASNIVRLAAADGTPVVARNFGFPAYLAWQEVGLLRRLLTSEPTPDLIVFYHGVNDYASVCRQIERGEAPVANHDFRRSTRPKNPVADCQADPEGTGATVERLVAPAMAQASEIAGAVPVLEFWQPYAGTREPGKDADDLMARLGLDEDARQRNAAGYRASLRAATRPVIDLTDAIGSTSGPIYFDWAHTNELGARLVAKAMWDRKLRDVTADLG